MLSYFINFCRVLILGNNKQIIIHNMSKNIYNPNLLTGLLDAAYRIFAPVNLSEVDGIKLIRKKVDSGEPFMASRIGSTELQTLSYIKFYPFLYFLKHRTYYNIQYASGFFPVTLKNLRMFYSMYKEDMDQLDILITWRFEELFFKNWFGKLPRINKDSFDNFFEQESPWTQSLKDKKVLVISPFAETIEYQYNMKRDKLFKNLLVLPEFKSLCTVKAVQSIAGEVVNFDSWFDALHFMKDEIDKCDYDIALLGCGAYAFPLAAHIKRMGKQAIHMGGVTQFLFGIRGKRYDESPFFSSYINEYFVYPSVNDRPKNAHTVEGGCYW